MSRVQGGEMAPARGDRLSALPDATVACILSHLPTDEAVRTSVLSRRWRRAHEAVPVVDLADPAPGERHLDKRVAFSDLVCGAVLGRRGGGPVRALRLRSKTCPVYSTLHQCVLLALAAGAEDVDVRLREIASSPYRVEEDPPGMRLCPSTVPFLDKTSTYLEPSWFHWMTRRLFRHAGLRRLRLDGCAVDMPDGGIAIDSLQTLFLRRIADDGKLGSLVVRCPGLVDLTVEECPTVEEISFSGDRLRSFTLRCCHKIRRLAVDAPRLRSLRYHGALPDQALFSMLNCPEAELLEISVCERVEGDKMASVPRVAEFIGRHRNLACLCLWSRPVTMFSGMQLSADLANLKRLELKGHLGDNLAVAAVVGALEKAPNLETLALCFMPTDIRKEDYFKTRPKIEDGGGGNTMDSNNIDVPKDVLERPVKCLESTLKRIDLLDLQGRLLERQLAKLLLAKATQLLELSATFANCCGNKKNEMMRELTSWRANRLGKLWFDGSVTTTDIGITTPEHQSRF
ncbi:unnamed protein product [Urochloa humidicola]